MASPGSRKRMINEAMDYKPGMHTPSKKKKKNRRMEFLNEAMEQAKSKHMNGNRKFY